MLKNPLSRRSDAHALYSRTILDNGIRVVSERVSSVRSVSLGLWADVGSRDESSATNGITHFLEHMVFKGTRNRSVADIARSLERLGGYLNAFTAKEHTCFHARVLDVHLPAALDVVSDLVLHATFSPQEMEKEKLVVIEELRSAEDNPEDIIHDYFEKALFPRHSLWYPIIGTEENLRRFSREDLRSHVRSHYLSGRLVVAAAGNVEHGDLVRHVRRFFSGRRVRAQERCRGPLPARIPDRGRCEYDRPIQQAHVCIGTRAYGMRHRERYPLLVLNALLGEGMSSRLYQSVREKHGLAYAIYSYVNMLSDTGVFGVYAGTEGKNTERTIELIRRELDRVRNHAVPRAELQRTKAQIRGTMLLSLENMTSRMMRLGVSELYLGRVSPLEAILRGMGEVTPERVQAVAQDLFRDERLSAVIIRPGKGASAPC
ncbi:MAG: pitrilysin family protein [Bacteroidota bacterium]